MRSSELSFEIVTIRDESRAPIVVVQRLGVATFSEALTPHQVDVFTRHLRAAYAELEARCTFRPGCEEPCGLPREHERHVGPDERMRPGAHLFRTDSR